MNTDSGIFFKTLAYHEAAHTVVARLLSNDHAIKFVTLSAEKIREEAPDKVGMVGLTFTIPKNENYVYTVQKRD